MKGLLRLFTRGLKISMTIILPGILLFVTLPAEAGKIVLLTSRDDGPYAEVCKAIEQSGNLEIEKVNLADNSPKAVKAVQDLSPDQADKIIAVGIKAIILSKKVDSRIPVIYTMVYNPVKFENRKSAGIIIRISVAEQIARLRELFPERKRIGVVFNPQYSGNQINQARGLMKKYDFQLFAIPVGNQEEISGALKRFSKGIINILWLVADQTVAHPESLKKLAAYSKQQRIPLIGLSRYHIQKGALAAFSVDFKDIGRQVAARAGKDFAEQEVEEPQKVIMFINGGLKKELGISDLTDLPGNIFIQ
ncbi:hypothetical protein KAR34_09475 [bacterium]|nr:hypothetical protein [bacterium]